MGTQGALWSDIVPMLNRQPRVVGASRPGAHLLRRGPDEGEALWQEQHPGALGSSRLWARSIASVGRAGPGAQWMASAARSTCTGRLHGPRPGVSKWQSFRPGRQRRSSGPPPPARRARCSAWGHRRDRRHRRDARHGDMEPVRVRRCACWSAPARVAHNCKLAAPQHVTPGAVAACVAQIMCSCYRMPIAASPASYGT